MADNEDHDRSFAEFLWSALPESGKRQLEENMSAGALEDTKSELTRCIEEAVNDAHAAGQAEGRKAGWVRGQARGRADATIEAILTVLDARGIDAADDPRGSFAGAGLIQFNEWLRRAATVDSYEDLFA